MIDFGSINTSTYTYSRPDSSSTSRESSTKDRLSPENTKENETNSKKSNATGTASEQDLTATQLRELTELKQRDREVRAHEQAHISAGGSYVRGGAHFEYEQGPDGKNYATGGEVSIDTSKVAGDPEATIKKMQVIRGAAIAPASPSAQDRKVAAQATRIENQARMQLLTQRYEEAAALRSDMSETESTTSDSLEQHHQGATVSLGGLVDISQ